MTPRRRQSLLRQLATAEAGVTNELAKAREASRRAAQWMLKAERLLATLERRP